MNQYLMRKALIAMMALCAVLNGCGSREHGHDHGHEHEHEAHEHAHTHGHIEITPERQELLGIRVEAVSEVPFS